MVTRVRAFPSGDGAMVYTGHLETADGKAVDGETNIGLALYQNSSGGVAVCQVESGLVRVSNGVFQIALPSACVDAVHSNAKLYLAVSVAGQSLGRTLLGGVPYAFEAAHATAADHAAASDHATTADSAATASGTLADTLAKTVKDGDHPTFTCPSDMTRMGAGCIDKVRSATASGGVAVRACNDAGKDLCSLQQLNNCDSLVPSGSGCSADTDDPNVTLWTSSVDPVSSSYFLLKGDNSVFAATSNSYPYYCCTNGVLLR